MQQILLLFGERVALISAIIGILCTLIYTTGCVNSTDRAHASEDLFRVRPGEERADFLRLVAWISAHDGNISLKTGTTLWWRETPYYRWYSNESCVVVCCPPRFSEKHSEIRWLAGSVKPGVSFSDAMRGEYKVEGHYLFPALNMLPATSSEDGVFGVRFGDTKERLLEILNYNQEDAVAANRRIECNKITSGAFDIDKIKGNPGTRLMLNLTTNNTVSYIVIRMPFSPGLAGTDFMDKEPPIIRQGSINVGGGSGSYLNL